MAEYDGSIRVGVKVEAEEAKKQLEHLKNRLVSQVKAIDDQARAVQKLKDQYERLSAVDPLEKNAKQIKKTTAELEAAQKEAERLEREYEALFSIKKQLGGMASPELQADIDNMVEPMAKAGEEVERLKAKLHDLKMDPTTTDEAKALRDAIAEAETALGKLKQSGQDTSNQIKQTESALNAASTALQSLKDNAEVADQGILDVQEQLAALESHKADLEAAGVGLGYKDYDETILKIQQINQQLREYRANLATADKADALKNLRDSATVTDQSIVDLSNELEALKRRKAELESAGVGLGFEEYDNAVIRIQEINSELDDYRSNLGKPPDDAPQNWVSRLGGAVSWLGSVIKKSMASSSSSVRSLHKRVSALGREKGFDKLGNAAAYMLRRIKNLIAGAFFYRIIGRQLRALVSGIGDYLVANERFADALSSLKSNFLTAFQPVYEAVMPALSAMMEAMSAATARFAAFMATVYGTTASQAQENAKALYEQAHATEETGEAAKKAQKQQEKYLASFDTIQKLGSTTKKEEEESEAPPKFDTDYSQVKPPQWMIDFWTPIKESWDYVGGSTIQLAKDALGGVWDLVKSIGRAFLDMWNSLKGLEVLNNFQLLLQTILRIIHDIAAAFMTAWDSGTGEQVIQALFSMLDSVLALLISIRQSFIDAWNDNGRGVAICNTILQIVRDIFNIVGNLAARLREAWEANGNGKAIWGAILDIAQIILSTIQKITSATAEWASKLNFEPLISAIRNFMESLVPVIQIIGDTLVDIWQDTVLPFLSWLIETALPGLFDGLASLMDWLAENEDVLKSLIKFVLAFIASWAITSVIQNIIKLSRAFNPVLLAIQLVISAVALLISSMERLNLEPITTSFAKLFDSVKPLVSAIVNDLSWAWENILVPLGQWVIEDAVPKSINVLAESFGFLGKIVGAVYDVLDALSPVLSFLWKNIMEPFASFLGGLFIQALNLIAGAIELIGDLLSGLINLLVEAASQLSNFLGLSGARKGSFGDIGSGGIGGLSHSYRTANASAFSAYDISNAPRLANGAVISPNSEFLAILGDQRSGTNIEAPLSVITKAVQDALGDIGGGETIVKVNFTGSLSQLARILNPQIQVEQRRIGSNLVGV